MRWFFYIWENRMKLSILILLALLCCEWSYAQQTAFPKDWVGNWKGELIWIRSGKTDTTRVTVQLRIHPADSINTYTWQIIYGSAGEDNRPYLLKPVDPAKGHWVVDEKNGILLDQFLIGNRLCGAFTVQQSTIINQYWMEGDRLMIEFCSVGAKPIHSSGKGTEESPAVNSYKVTSYQKAELRREN